MNTDIRGKKYNRTMMILVMMLGSFITLLTETFLNNALPSIMKSFNINQATAQWLSTGYLMVAGLMIPLSAWLFKRFDVRKTFITFMFVFLIGSVMGYFAPNFGVLLAGRLIQAISAGSLMPLIQNVMFILYPANKRGTVMGISGIVIAFAPAIGPTLSGYIIDSFGWRYLFGILIPLTLVFILLAFIFVKSVNKTEAEKVDTPSIVYSTAGFGLLLYGFSIIGNDGKVTLATTSSMIIGLIIIYLFVRRQLKLKQPLIEVRVFKNKTFTLTAILSALSNIALLGVELVMPLYLQNVHGVSALTSGLVLLPGSLLMAVMSPISGMLYDKFGMKKLAFIGYGILTLGTLPMMFFTKNTSLILISVLYMIRISGISLVMMNTYTEGINALDQKMAIHGNAASSTVRQIAGSLGTAVLMMLISLYTANSTSVSSLTTGYHAAFILAIVMSALGFILSFWLKQKKSIKQSN